PVTRVRFVREKGLAMLLDATESWSLCLLSLGLLYAIWAPEAILSQGGLAFLCFSSSVFLAALASMVWKPIPSWFFRHLVVWLTPAYVFAALSLIGGPPRDAIDVFSAVLIG